MKTFTYVVLGAGRQGTAAGYDMARWGYAQKIILADDNLQAASRAAERVNRLVGWQAAQPARVDVTDLVQVEGMLRQADACLSAVPYYYNLGITQAALRAKTSLCDLGGHVGIARQQHALDAEARQAGIGIIPSCGQVPGLGTTLMVYAIGQLDRAVDVWMWDGGLPQNPKPPFNYMATFNIAGLTNEYAEPAVFLREGKIAEVPSMTELETVSFPEPIGELEAFVTGGGLDTLPWMYAGRLRTLQNKTLRYPGSFAQLRAFCDLGLLDLEPLSVGGVRVVPREVFQALFEPKVTFPQDRDLVIVRVKAVGEKGGRPAQVLAEVIDYFDEATGFTAMERTTGWSAAIVAEMLARGETPHGAGGVETLVPAGRFIEELRKRGIQVTG